MLKLLSHSFINLGAEVLTLQVHPDSVLPEDHYIILKLFFTQSPPIYGLYTEHWRRL